jgi:hypothetical protein
MIKTDQFKLGQMDKLPIFDSALKFLRGIQPRNIEQKLLVSILKPSKFFFLSACLLGNADNLVLAQNITQSKDRKKRHNNDPLEHRHPMKRLAMLQPVAAHGRTSCTKG